jgi:peroxiredoxin
MPMRSLRTWLAVGVVLGFSPAVAFGKQITPAQMLSLRPVVEGGSTEYDTPTDAAAIGACKVENVTQPSGYLLRDGQGKILRRFVATIGSKQLNQYSYYQDGFEVYREVDIDGKPDGDKKVIIDEARWMNAGGTRIAAVVNNKILSWKRISAEEASKVMVQALATSNVGLLNTVMATPEELASLGVPASEVERLKGATEKRRDVVTALQNGLVGWDKKTVWQRFDATLPHSIPVDSLPAGPGDLLLYENAVIWAGQPGGALDNKAAFLQASELVKTGDTWKFVDLPRAINPANNAPVIAMEGGIRSAIFRDAAGGPAQNPAQDAATKALAEYDNASAGLANGSDKKKQAEFYVGRIPLLRGVVKAITKPEDRLQPNKEIADALARAYQTGHYPAGLKLLLAMEEDGGKIASYAAGQRINADYLLENENPNANVVAIQKKWMNDMRDFLGKYKDSDEAPDMLFQLASNCEFNAEEKEAREYYDQLVKQYSDTLSGKKAAGAVHRMDIEGKAIALKGPTLDGQTVDITRYRGKTVLVVFWATTVPAAKRDLPEIAKILDKNKAKGFEVIGICLDPEAQPVQAFLKAEPLPWPTIFEPGGTENRLGVEYGIITIPTMFLVDTAGKVIKRNIRSAADLDVQLEKALAGKGNGVALGREP